MTTPKTDKKKPAAAKRVTVKKVVVKKKVAVAAVETKAVSPAPVVEEAKADTTPVTIGRDELTELVRKAAWFRARARQFRGGNPANDWFAAEAAVKAALTSRGVQLPA